MARPVSVHDAARARQILTPAEAARELGRSKTWVVEKCASGLLPSRRDGSRYLLLRSELIRDGWLAADVHQPPTDPSAA